MFVPSAEFFDAFDQHAAATLGAARSFQAFVEERRSLEDTVLEIRAAGRACENLRATTRARLGETFLVPLQRDKIVALLARLARVERRLQAGAERLWVYGIRRPTPQGRALARVLVQSVSALAALLGGLRDRGRYDEIPALRREVHRLRGESDAVLRSALADLLASPPLGIEALQWQDVYEQLGRVALACERAARLIDEIVE